VKWENGKEYVNRGFSQGDKSGKGSNVNKRNETCRRKCRGLAIRALVVSSVLVGLFSSRRVAAESSTVDVGELHRRLLHASSLSFGGYRLSADVTTRKETANSQDKINRALARYQKTLEAMLKAGKYPSRWPRDKIDNAPEDKRGQILEYYRQRDMANYLEDLHHRYLQEEQGYSVSVAAAPDGRSVRTIQYEYRVTNGKRKDRSRVEVRVLRPEFSAMFMPLSKWGEVDVGLRDRPSLAASRFGETPLHLAGNPSVGGMTAENIISVQPNVDGRGTIRVVYDRANGPTRTTLVVDVLPEKGYMAKSVSLFNNGSLAFVQTYGDYRRVGSRWYPFVQERRNYSNGAELAFAQALKTNNWAFMDDVLAGTVKADRFTSIRYEMRSVQPLAELPNSELDILMTAGSLVVDKRFDKDIRLRLTRDAFASEVFSQISPQVGHVDWAVRESLYDKNIAQADEVLKARIAGIDQLAFDKTGRTAGEQSASAMGGGGPHPRQASATGLVAKPGPNGLLWTSAMALAGIGAVAVYLLYRRIAQSAKE